MINGKGRFEPPEDEFVTVTYFRLQRRTHTLSLSPSISLRWFRYLVKLEISETVLVDLSITKLFQLVNSYCVEILGVECEHDIDDVTQTQGRIPSAIRAPSWNLKLCSTGFEAQTRKEHRTNS